MKSFHFLISACPGMVLRMRFSGENQLDWALGIAKQPNQPLRIMQQKVGPLISSKAARESYGEHMFIE